MADREENEKKFKNWIDRSDGTRMYWYEVKGRRGWFARYVKVVDKDEMTLSFRQEVFDEKSNLVEIHEKYPFDKGHRRLKE